MNTLRLFRVFFGRLYYYGYLRQSRNDSDYEIVVIGFISICQTFNISTILNVLALVLGIKFNFLIVYVCFYFIIYFSNYYYYEIRKNKLKILNTEIYRGKSTAYLSFIYLILSVFLFFGSLFIYTNSS